ncbi:MAG TPA: VOC family protein [Thermomicrobiales bacterium]|nr:VOC family protein [Thermomicrobiales bacterium]
MEFARLEPLAERRSVWANAARIGAGYMTTNVEGAATAERGKRVQVTFDVEGRQYACALKPFEIIHDGIHHALPEDMRKGQRLVLRGPAGEEVYPDMFAGEVARGYGAGNAVTLSVSLTPIPAVAGPWRNIGFDHLAIVVEDREGAFRFFTGALGMQEMRHDPHMTVLTTGHTGLFLFDAGEDVPLSDGLPSRWHHLGFVVDSLDHAFYHLQQYAELVSDFTLLERQERWSLYGHYRNGDVTFMIQLSEIRDGWKGFDNPAAITDFLYDYSGRRYGKRLE